MLTNRILWRPLCYCVLGWSIALALVPSSPEAAPIFLNDNRLVPSTSEVQRLEERVLMERLRQIGLSSDEITARLETLSPQERHELAGRLETLGAGGDVAGAIAVVLVVFLLVVLVLELMGRRVISRG